VVEGRNELRMGREANGSSSRAYVETGCEGRLGRDEGPGSFMVGDKVWARRGSCAASALPQLSLRLAMLVRLSGEGNSEGEPGVIAAGVATSSMADEEELWTEWWEVSTDMRA